MATRSQTIVIPGKHTRDKSTAAAAPAPVKFGPPQNTARPGLKGGK